MRASEWIERFARELGAEAPDRATVDDLLELAATAAHSSERIAAPIACYLTGVSGTDVEVAKRAAERVAPAPGDDDPRG